MFMVYCFIVHALLLPPCSRYCCCRRPGAAVAALLLLPSARLRLECCYYLVLVNCYYVRLIFVINSHAQIAFMTGIVDINPYPFMCVIPSNPYKLGKSKLATCFNYLQSLNYWLKHTIKSNHFLDKLHYELIYPAIMFIDRDFYV